MTNRLIYLNFEYFIYEFYTIVPVKENIVREKAWNLLVRLFKEAKRDGEIDKDEERILRTTDINATHLLEYVTEAWSDKRLKEIEKAQIVFLIKKLEDDAITLAQYDEIITKQEEALLQIIGEMVFQFLNMN